MKIGLQLHPDRGIAAVFEEARLADEQGFDSMWMSDHLMGTTRATERPDDCLAQIAEIESWGVTQQRVGFCTLEAQERAANLLLPRLAWWVGSGPGAQRKAAPAFRRVYWTRKRRRQQSLLIPAERAHTTPGAKRDVGKSVGTGGGRAPRFAPTRDGVTRVFTSIHVDARGARRTGALPPGLYSAPSRYQSA